MAVAAPQSIDWSQFDEEVFAERTAYSIDGNVLQATSEAAASGLFREQEIDLAATPWLCWRWRATKFPDVGDMTQNDHDDYAARVYVVDKRGLFGSRTVGLNYVWIADDNGLESWPNPFAKRVRMVPLRTGPGEWTSEARNVKTDFQEFAGIDVDSIDAVAVMTDSDNSRSSSAAEYGQLAFVADRSECPE